MLSRMRWAVGEQDVRYGVVRSRGVRSGRLGSVIEDGVGSLVEMAAQMRARVGSV